jgi:hypothetical protein
MWLLLCIKCLYAGEICHQVAVVTEIQGPRSFKANVTPDCTGCWIRKSLMLSQARRKPGDGLIKK